MIIKKQTDAQYMAYHVFNKANRRITTSDQANLPSRGSIH